MVAIQTYSKEYKIFIYKLVHVVYTDWCLDLVNRKSGIMIKTITLGLNNIRYLCEKLNNPQDKLRFIHIAGTNGKGSVGAYISSILKEAGCKVGVYSSPAVFNPNEIIRINSRPISKADMERIMKEVNDACEQMTSEGLSEPSQFEKETAAAFLFFAEKECDIAVLECGMGGLTDATNIVKNTLVSVFTSIGLDHMQYLGDTVDKITSVKAGIIKKGCRVVTTADNLKEALDVIISKANEYGCEVDITKNDKKLSPYILLRGEHQIQNASIAVAAVKALPKEFTVSDKDIQKGLHNAKWPGRFELISNKPDIVIDGAHNPDAANKLAAALKKYYSGRKLYFIVGMLCDKDHDEVMRITAPMAEQILTVSTFGQRGLSAVDMAQSAMKFSNNVTSIGGIEEALDMALLMAGKKDVIVVFGTLSFLKEVKAWIKRKDMKK